MKLASIETILEIRPHTNADRLEIATVLGWQSVVRKGEFKAGDRAVFVVIDTILPVALWSAFLAHASSPDLPIRLKTAKLRGEYSQGLVLPLTVLPEHIRDWHEGADVGGELGIKKYDKEIPGVLSGEAKSAFPSHYAPRTDEDNGLSNPAIVAMVLNEPRIGATLKLDGSSCTIVLIDGVLTDVCSRNLSLREDTNNGFWRAVRGLSFNLLPDAMSWSGRTILQGELMGPGIQGNQLKLTEPTLYLFNVYNDQPGWLSHSGVRQIAALIGAQSVPEVEIDAGTSDMAGFQSIADRQKLPCGAPAEGIVVRPVQPKQFGNGRPAGFKIINRNYSD